MSLILALSFVFCSFAVFASEGDPTNLTMEGASIRTEGEQGLRFVGKVIRADYELTKGTNANFGILLIPQSMIGKAEKITVETENVSIVPAKNILTTTEEYYEFSAVLTGIPAEAYGTEIVARAYVKVGDDYVYSKQISRSVKSVADEILKTADAPQVDVNAANEVLAKYNAVGEDILVDFENIWNAMNDLIVYPEYPEVIARDYLYSVSVTQGNKTEDLMVYNQTEAFYYQDRFEGGDVNRRFCEFAFSGQAVTVDIRVNQDFSTYTVAPTSKGFDTSYANGVISVTVTEPVQLVVMLDDDVNTAMAIFADAPETDVPAKDDPNTVYVEGFNNITLNNTEATLENGVLTMSKRSTQLYIAPGAVLAARVVTPQDNSDANVSYAIKIFGRGAIVDPASLIYHVDVHGYDNATATSEHMVKIGGYSSVVQDIKILDSRRFNLNINRGSCTVENVKILSTMMTSDGITTTANSGTVKNCFVYCGDNALVSQVGEGDLKGYSFENITVGTTCSAIYPQYYCDSTFTDIYVFRADEGLISMKHGEAAKTVEINNLDALDCVRTPWLFFAEDVGSGAKSVTINKVLMNYTTGSSTCTVAPGNGTSEKAMYSFATLSAGSNYTFNITDMYVGGTLITDGSQVKKSGSPSNFSATYASSGNTPATLAHGKTTVNYTCADKVHIGARQIYLSDRAVEVNGTWYLPYEEIMAYFAVAPTTTPVVTMVNGVEMISLSNLVASGVATAATYNAGVKITAAVNSTVNLLEAENYNTSSNFNPLKYKDKTEYITATNNNGTWEYTALSASSDGGIVIMIRDLYQQYGAGTYKITFDYKGSSSKTVTAGIGIDHTDKSKSTSCSGTTSWTTKTWSVTLSNDPADVDQMALWFKIASGYSVSIRNLTITKTN